MKHTCSLPGLTPTYSPTRITYNGVSTRCSICGAAKYYDRHRNGWYPLLLLTVRHNRHYLIGFAWPLEW